MSRQLPNTHVGRQTESKSKKSSSHKPNKPKGFLRKLHQEKKGQDVDQATQVDAYPTQSHAKISLVLPHFHFSNSKAGAYSQSWQKAMQIRIEIDILQHRVFHPSKATRDVFER